MSDDALMKRRFILLRRIFLCITTDETTMDGSNGDAAAGGPNPAGGDGPGQGGVALLSDPVDVIIDKLLR